MTKFTTNKKKKKRKSWPLVVYVQMWHTIPCFLEKDGQTTLLDAVGSELLHVERNRAW